MELIKFMTVSISDFSSSFFRTTGLHVGPLMHFGFVENTASFAYLIISLINNCREICAENVQSIYMQFV